jgi:hypothetical protein
MQGLRRTGVMALAVAAALLIAHVASADQWSEKTILTFTEPVMIPGATLQPGSYVFKLVDSSTDRNLVEISNERTGQVITTTQAVPAARENISGDVVLKFSPTEPGTAPAIRAWFYPGSIYGHQFVYPDNQAREIAARTKTLVLSTDVPGTDLTKGTLYLYDAAGVRTNWHLDALLSNDWNRWRTSAEGSGMVRTAPGNTAHNESTAPAIETKPIGTKVPLDQIEDYPSKYIGQTISVDAEVEKVLGPHLFTIDEPGWIDLEGETLVYLPSNLAALVHEGDRVTVSGTMKKMVLPDLRREWGWLDTTPAMEARLTKRPLLVASRVVGGDRDRALLIDVNRSTASTPVGTSGTADGGSTIADVTKISSMDDQSIGRTVALNDVAVAKSAGRGFWLRVANGSDVFVLPAAPGQPSVHEGQTVSVDGVVLQMPRSMRDRLDAPKGANTQAYIYATSVNNQR